MGECKIPAEEIKQDIQDTLYEIETMEREECGMLDVYWTQNKRLIGANKLKNILRAVVRSHLSPPNFNS